MNMRRLTVFFLMGAILLCVHTQANFIPVANHSFEMIEINPDTNPQLGIPLVPLWTELDNDKINSFNTGTFRNTAESSEDHIVNADGDQLAFLGSVSGNSLSQFTASKYQVGKSYRLTVGVCISASVPPVGGDPLILEFIYWDVFNSVPIVTLQVPATGLTSFFLEDFTLNLPTVQSEDVWANRNIGITIRASGEGGGFWDLDNVRVMEFPGTPDFTGDSVVNLPDFAKMAADWLSCSQVTTDVTGDGCVNGADLQILAEYWLDDV